MNVKPGGTLGPCPAEPITADPDGGGANGCGPRGVLTWQWNTDDLGLNAA